MSRRKKQTVRLTPKQAICSVLALAAAFFILTLLNDAMGGQLPLPGAQEVSQAVMETVDGLYSQAGLSAKPTPRAEGTVSVHYIDVGQADSILIETEEQNVLIDAGDVDSRDALLDYLRVQKVERIDLLIATHPHADHIGSMADVVASLEIGNVLFADMPVNLTPTSRTFERLLDAIDAKGLKITKAKPGMQYDLGAGASLTLLAPLKEYPEDLNDNSVVCRLTFGKTAFLFTGDAGKESENDLLARYSDDQLACNVLKLGHHGSNTASQLKWLSAVKPAFAVACVGYDNSYGHPHREVLARLKKLGIPLYRTDQNGSIVASSDGKTVLITTEKE